MTPALRSCLHPGCPHTAAIGTLCVRHAEASRRKPLVRGTVLVRRPDPIEAAARDLAAEVDLHDVPDPDAVVARRERVGGDLASLARAVAMRARAVADERGSGPQVRARVTDLHRALEALTQASRALGDVLADVDDGEGLTPAQVLRRQGGWR